MPYDKNTSARAFAQSILHQRHICSTEGRKIRPGYLLVHSKRNVNCIIRAGRPFGIDSTM